MWSGINNRHRLNVMLLKNNSVCLENWHYLDVLFSSVSKIKLIIFTKWEYLQKKELTISNKYLNKVNQQQI